MIHGHFYYVIVAVVDRFFGGIYNGWMGLAVSLQFDGVASGYKAGMALNTGLDWIGWLTWLFGIESLGDIFNIFLTIALVVVLFSMVQFLKRLFTPVSG